ncbi:MULTISPECIES: hypothetical protein [Pseudoalteromonas]|uniref:Uncharacterized protein n=1 Tax=Pseudoalteromonas fuliginea TaxID=1872678 RepID=A0ABQ6RNI7_9GAMM|nr:MULTISPECIES: hypothetical protein [Pseudoalteromonas]KAA1166991.1 hypothetical protein EU509_00085 [Pseudoalteromonas fuliginea]KAA1170270.1 hypothetical protein EUZ79_00030 [Pseudoalteromonas fuliginea]MDQ2046126.1 hypothetical protein [Pseudoalteromonas sp. 20-92]
MRILVILISVLCCFKSLAHTWDEPWHGDVVKGANSFAIFKVLKNTGSSLKLELIKHISGEKPHPNIIVNDFYLYDVVTTNAESDEHGFWLKDGVNAYMFLLKQGDSYKIATPTSGYAEILEDGSVAATYRHSLHQAKAQTENYEKTQVCIFNKLHGSSCSTETIEESIITPLNEKVAILSAQATASDFELFFKQHAALETSFLIEYPLEFDVLKPFLTSQFFHAEISGVRALSVGSGTNKVEQLISFIKKDKSSDVAKVMALIMLKNLDGKNVNPSIVEYYDQASEAEVSLGGNFMDPRIGTWYPHSVKKAIEWYIGDNSPNRVAGGL